MQLVTTNSYISLIFFFLYLNIIYLLADLLKIKQPWEVENKHHRWDRRQNLAFWFDKPVGIAHSSYTKHVFSG